jgi:hypothetical protein
MENKEVDLGHIEITEAQFKSLMRDVEGLIRKKRCMWLDQKVVFYNLDLKLKTLGSVVIEESSNQ